MLTFLWSKIFQKIHNDVWNKTMSKAIQQVQYFLCGWSHVLYVKCARRETVGALSPQWNIFIKPLSTQGFPKKGRRKDKTQT